MFYSFIRVGGIALLNLLNGRLKVLNKQNLPSGNYILVGPHRTWLDPVYFAYAASPKHVAFMAKKELFTNAGIGFILRHCHGIPVDRNNPGPSVIKTPVKWLRKKDLSLIMFPSGTRHSTQLKGGVVLIAKMAGVPIVPCVYQGPMTFKQLLKRKKATVAIGEPIVVDHKVKINSESEQAVISKMDEAFAKLDEQIDPTFKYIAK